jgi:hypothetical protein
MAVAQTPQSQRAGRAVGAQHQGHLSGRRGAPQ